MRQGFTPPAGGRWGHQDLPSSPLERLLACADLAFFEGSTLEDESLKKSAVLLITAFGIKDRDGEGGGGRKREKELFFKKILQVGYTNPDKI